MKKNYNQPIVEVAEVFATSLMNAASPNNDALGGGSGGSGDPIAD